MDDFTKLSHFIVDDHIDTLKELQKLYQTRINELKQRMEESGISEPLQQAIAMEMVIYVEQRSKELE